jgi:hypothetical protein
MATSNYFDPTTNMLTFYKDGGLVNTAGASVDLELGLSDFSDLDDVKIKILSIEYKVKTFTDNGATAPLPDNNAYAFNYDLRSAGGNYLFGVKNKDDVTVFNDLDDFTGTSAWPVHMTSWASLIGNPASATKTWKPDKLALSHEQVAFLTVRNNSGVTNAVASYSWASIVIRAIRL